ncbi:hypothetical protein [Paraliobacillus sediminis]|uniref:hypothetical protein n=1 Tax=Paraliobacillus sediminis TaxID=1885916 RepID=UPI000E3E14EE|nr:hypothetical protein [Paraliobacillus sediminis]
MKQYAVLRLLLAGFLLYLALPSIQTHPQGLAQLYWFSWLVLFSLVFGANLATVLIGKEVTSRAVEHTKQVKTMKN